MADNKLSQLASEYGAPRQAVPRHMLERMAQDIEVRKAIAQRNAPASIRDEEQGLQGGMELGDIGGVPVSLTDLLPVDLGASALMKGGAALAAKFAAAKAAGLSAVPLMAGTFIGKNAKTWDSITAAKAAEMKVSGHAGADTWAATHSGNPLNPPSMYDVPVDQQIVRPSDNGPAMSIVPGSAEQWAMKNKSFSPEGMRSQKIGDYTYHIEDVGGGDGIIHAVDSSGRKVGDTFFGEGDMPGFINGSVGVDPEFRRRGIASTMYKLAEDVSGKKIIPEVTHTDDATAFWNQPNRTFGTDIASSKSPYQQLVEDSRAKVKAIIPQRENLNAALLDKHLSGDALTPEEMAQYELNGRAMEQGRGDINAANAQAQGADYSFYKGQYPTAPSKRDYHGTIGDTYSNEYQTLDAARSDLGFHIGTIQQAETRVKDRYGMPYQQVTDGENYMPLVVDKYAPLLKVSDDGSFHADSISPQLEKKKLLAKGYTKKILSDPLGDSDPRAWDALYDAKMRDVLSQNDFSGVKYNNTTEGDGISKAITDTSKLRLPWASFDPLRAKSSSPLAAITAASTAPLLYDLATRNEDYQ